MRPMRGKLEEIQDELRKGRLNELWGCLGLLMRRSRWEEGRGEWAVGDDEGLGQNAQVGFFVLPFLFLFF